MTANFYPAIAEHVIAVVQAVASANGPVDGDFVSAFTDLRSESVESALNLAVDLGFLDSSADTYSASSPLCRFVQTPDVTVKAAAVRVMLESYRPFVIFRERLVATGDVAQAAAETRALLDLDVHRDDISTTLVSLGTFARALVAEGGGHHKPDEAALGSPLLLLAEASAELAAAERQVRTQLGAASTQSAYTDVIRPLAEALVRAAATDPRGAVTLAGNAVESYLGAMAGRAGVSVDAAHGINAKTQALAAAGHLPKKLQAVGGYLGGLRNAADHGADPDVQASWDIAPESGIEYVFVACSFLRSLDFYERRQGHIL